MAHNYSSWLLRYVPDPVRGEFVNVGVIVGRNGGDWAIRFVDSYTRASRLGGNATLLRPTLRSLAARVTMTNGKTPPKYRGFKEMASETAMSIAGVEEMAARFNNALRISETRASYGNSAEDLAVMLYSHLVYDIGHQAQSRARTRMRSEFRDAVKKSWDGEVSPLLDRPTVQIGKLRQQFDFALHQEEVEQMTHVISITRKNQEQVRQEINAWNYSVRLIRDKGAVVLPSADSEQLLVQQETPIMLVHDQPTTEAQWEILEAAREGWATLGVEDVSQDRISTAARTALQLVA
jgi:Protein of unknown function (DUF3037)